jgi:REP element-mobilizing transposase RayT
MEYGHFYHIYNHANGGEDLFVAEDNYYYFLQSAIYFLSPVAEVNAYCLMPNHFHLLVRIKKENALKKSLLIRQKQLFKLQKKTIPEERFLHDAKES